MNKNKTAKGLRTMRLIDADALIEFIDPGHLHHPGELAFSEVDVVNMLNHAPTAYKPDAVKAELEQLKLDGVCNNENCVDCQYYGICDAGERSEELTLDKAIEIVERGGVDGH